MANVDPEIAHFRAVHAAHSRWSKPGARKQQSDKLSAARIRRHEDLVDPDRQLDAKERRQLAENSLRAEMADLSRRAVKARRKLAEKAAS